MKRLVFLALALVASVSFSDLLRSQEGGDGKPRPEGQPRPEGGNPPRPGGPGGPGNPGGPGGQGGRGNFLMTMPVHAALDLDKNGEISAEELGKASQSLKALDKNSDGKLTEEELRPNFGGRPPGGQGGPGGRPEGKGDGSKGGNPEGKGGAPQRPPLEQ